MVLTKAKNKGQNTAAIENEILSLKSKIEDNQASKS
jgi:hypothetical protein